MEVELLKTAIIIIKKEYHLKCSKTEPNSMHHGCFMCSRRLLQTYAKYNSDGYKQLLNQFYYDLPPSLMGECLQETLKTLVSVMI